jgi:hypothetical protein
MDEPTLVDTLTGFRARGFDGDFSVDDGELRCSLCGECHRAVEAEIVEVARFEGESDPDDEAALFALRCLHCGHVGVLVTAYGPSVDAATAAVVTALHR